MKKVISIAAAGGVLSMMMAGCALLVSNAAAQSPEKQTINFLGYEGGKGARDTATDTITVSEQEIQSGDVKVYGGIYVPDEGNHFSSLCLQLAINDTFEHSSSQESLRDLHTVGGITMDGSYANPYCFIEDSDAYQYDEVDESSCNPAMANPADWNPETFMLNWRTGLVDENGVPINAVYYEGTKDLPVFEYEITLPKGLAPGKYVLNVYTEKYINILGTRKVPMVSDADAQQLQWGTMNPLTIIVEGDSSTSGTLGDVNFDGIIDSDDAVLCLKQANAEMMGEEFLTAEQLSVADVNGDGLIDSDDCVLIMKHANAEMMGEELPF